MASRVLNLVPFLGLIFSLALSLAAAILQFNTPEPFVIITLTVLFLHIVSANFLIPKFIATRVSIGPVAATIGLLVWGWLWGVMGLLLAVALTALVKLIADLHSSLHHFSNMLALTPGRFPVGCDTIRRNHRGAGDSLLPRPRGNISVSFNPPAELEKNGNCNVHSVKSLNICDLHY